MQVEIPAGRFWKARPMRGCAQNTNGLFCPCSSREQVAKESNTACKKKVQTSCMYARQGGRRQSLTCKTKAQGQGQGAWTETGLTGGVEPISPIPCLPIGDTARGIGKEAEDEGERMAISAGAYFED